MTFPYALSFGIKLREAYVYCSLGGEPPASGTSSVKQQAGHMLNRLKGMNSMNA